jgi:hypothetical protein
VSTFCIKPYTKGPNWFFDDPGKGLLKEGLTDGVPEMLVWLYERKKTTTGNAVVWFSSEPHACDVTLRYVGPWWHGSLYRCEDGRECWLCPALLRYYEEPPATLYVWLEAVQVI